MRVVVMTVISVCFLIAGLVINTPMFIFLSLLFFGPVPLFLLTRKRPVKINVTGEGLEVEHPYQLIPWNSLQTVRRVSGKQNPKATQKHQDVEILHEEGQVYINSPAAPPTETLFTSMMEKFSASGSREVPESLTSYLHDKEGAFGPEMVFSFTARKHLGTSRRSIYYCLAGGIVLGLVVALILAETVPSLQGPNVREQLMGVTGIAFIFAILLFLLGVSSQSNTANRPIKKWKQAGLVISPAGLALSQGTMEGELKWADITKVTFQKRAADGILIDVTGAQIKILDLYDRPLFLIYQHIMKYWRNEEV